jgi:hypothetical protein
VKLKYYMRGLGIGIVVTALLMGYVMPTGKETMTDEEIRQRALEMGMIEVNGVLADDLGDDTDDIEDTGETETTEPVISENKIETAEQTTTAEPETETAAKETAEPEAETTTKETAEQETETAANQQTAVETAEPSAAASANIVINSGEGSKIVSNKLRAAGVIDDATAFDSFLCKNGYDKKLTTGGHEITAGDTWEEIAKALTTKYY